MQRHCNGYSQSDKLPRSGRLDRCQRCLFLTFPCRSLRSSRRIISLQDQHWPGRPTGGEGGSAVEVHAAPRRGGFWQCCGRAVLCMMLAHHPWHSLLNLQIVMLGTLLDGPHLEFFVIRHGKRRAGKAWRVKDFLLQLPFRRQENQVESERLTFRLMIPPHGVACHASMDETVAASSAIDRFKSRQSSSRI